ncbi:MAG: hypothetical protein ACRDKL_02535 [Solirubrobacteraceae bacterium]
MPGLNGHQAKTRRQPDGPRILHHFHDARMAGHGPGNYCAFLGAELADRVAESTPTDTAALVTSAEAYADAGVDTLLFLPTSLEVAQLDLLADALATRPRFTGPDR